MVSQRYKLLYEKISRMIAQPARRTALYAAMHRSRQARATAMAQMADAQAFRHVVHSIKERSIAELDELVRTFTSNAQRHGARVYLARDAQDAVRYLRELAKAHNVKLVAKSKSLTSEEIEMNKPLEEAGIKVVETDLGEWIIQAQNEKPYHLVFPAVHRTKFEVAELLAKETGAPVNPEIEEITKGIRTHLRPVFLDADMGVTGANVAIAETGTIVIETNEGNARLVSSVPRLHVAIVGIEKIVRSWEEAAQMILAHPLSASGQRITNYVSFITGRSPLDGSEDRQLHIVLLDNARTRMREDPWFKEALFCIRCGACMNVCPTYGVVGGHVFGHIYPGPIGIPWTAEVHGLEKAAAFAPLCISCGLCREICPADIDIPMLIAKVKERDIEQSGQLLVNTALSEVESFARIASAAAPISNWILKRKLVRLLLEKTIGIERHRSLPEFRRRTFIKWYGKHHRKLADANRRVAYFVDVYANYNDPDLGRAAVKLLELSGAQVEVPPQQSSGMPYVSYGELKKARRVAEYNVSKLEPYVRQGYDVVATEPTAAYMLRNVYPKLLETEEARRVASKTFELFDYLMRLEDRSWISRVSLRSSAKKARFHISCHQRALTGGKPTIDLLREIGLEVEVIETGTCCGMAGTFGLKKGPLGYDLSMEVGKPLFELFRNSGVGMIITESSVCKMQLEHGTGLSVVHPVTLIREALRS